jgi:hypothetical protein
MNQEDRPSGNFQCVCGAVMRAQVPPRIVTNHQLYSAVAFPHEKPIVCPNCHKVYAFALAEFEGIWVIQAIEEAPTVVPATSMPPPDAQVN